MQKLQAIESSRKAFLGGNTGTMIEGSWCDPQAVFTQERPYDYINIVVHSVSDPSSDCGARRF